MRMPWNMRRVWWQCDRCWKENRWRWEWVDCMPGPVTMVCDECGYEQKGEMEPDWRWVRRWMVR